MRSWVSTIAPGFDSSIKKKKLSQVRFFPAAYLFWMADKCTLSDRESSPLWTVEGGQVWLDNSAIPMQLTRDMDRAITVQQRQKSQYKVQGQGQETQARMVVSKAPWVQFGGGLILILRMSGRWFFSLQGGWRWGVWHRPLFVFLLLLSILASLFPILPLATGTGPWATSTSRSGFSPAPGKVKVSAWSPVLHLFSMLLADTDVWRVNVVVYWIQTTSNIHFSHKSWEHVTVPDE